MGTDAQAMLKVNQGSLRAEGEGVYAPWKANKRGEGCVIDFYTAMILEGRGFQVLIGTVTTPATGDIVITDTAAEMCVDAGNGLIVIPVFCNISVRTCNRADQEYALKSVDVVSSGGTTFVPLPLLGDTNTPVSSATARAQEAGAVTVSAEVVTTTRRLWSVSNPLAVGAGDELTSHDYQPRMPHAIANGACCYMQCASAVAGPNYYAHIDWIEMPWVNVS